jgi:hypothetical protein
MLINTVFRRSSVLALQIPVHLITGFTVPSTSRRTYFNRYFIWPIGKMNSNLQGEPPLFPKTAFDRYKPLIEAGSGVRGTVYLCIERTIDGTKPLPANAIVAVKTFKAPPIGASLLQKIKEEIAKSPCRNLVALLDMTYLDAQSPRQHWYSMQAVKGCTFKGFLDEYNDDAPLAMYYHVLREAASAIRWLYHRELWYRDFIPENVMLEVEGLDRLPRVVLIDLDEVEKPLSGLAGRSLGMLFVLAGHVRVKFPTNVPLAWKSLGSKTFKELQRLRGIDGFVYVSKISSDKSSNLTPGEMLDWVDRTVALLGELEKLHSPETIKAIVEVVGNLWSKTEAKVMGMAQGDGLVVNL